MTSFKLIGTSYFSNDTKHSDYVCNSCGGLIQTFGEKVYPNIYRCPYCDEKCEERKDSVSKVKVKRIPIPFYISKKCCETCKYSSLHDIFYDGEVPDYKQERRCDWVIDDEDIINEVFYK